METQAVVKAERSLLTEMAMQYGLEPDNFLNTIKATVFPVKNKSGEAVIITNEQAAAFLVVAKQYNLNPFIKEIYAFPSRSGGITPIVSIDGWVSLVNRNSQFDGLEYVDHLEDGKLMAITCRMYVKGRAKPIEVTEYKSECFRDTEPWKQWPARMLRHKAYIQCARVAFGFSGVYDPDEAERIQEAQPSGRLELEADALPMQLPRAAIPEGPKLDKAMLSNGISFYVGQLITEIRGNVVKLLPALKKLNGRQEVSGNWTIPAVQTEDFLKACEMLGIVPMELGEDGQQVLATGSLFKGD